MNKTDIGRSQEKCQELGPLYKYLSHNELPIRNQTVKQIVIGAQQYEMLNGKMYHLFQYRTKNKHSSENFIYQLAIPKRLRQDVLLAYHDSQTGACHLGFKCTYETIRAMYFWKHMFQDFYDYVTSCTTCQELKRDTSV